MNRVKLELTPNKNDSIIILSKKHGRESFIPKVPVTHPNSNITLAGKVIFSVSLLAYKTLFIII